VGPPQSRDRIPGTSPRLISNQRDGGQASPGAGDGPALSAGKRDHQPCSPPEASDSTRRREIPIHPLSGRSPGGVRVRPGLRPLGIPSADGLSVADFPRIRIF
jgi:hypothetical protein